LCGGGNDMSIYQISFPEGELLNIINPLAKNYHECCVGVMKISKDMKYLIFGENNLHIEKMNRRDFLKCGQNSGHRRCVLCLDISPNK
jgi:hypothetical protein